MAHATTDSEPKGFTFLRVLSARERSKVWLAKCTSGDLCALKVQQPRNLQALPAISARYRRLQGLTSPESGLLPILAYGSTPDSWLWESLRLADNLPGLQPLTGDAGIEQYTPLTLRAWYTDQGPVPPRQVAQWGARLARALSTLHVANFVHRDVKPTNIVFLEGNPALADYGLLGEPGSALDFCGTEGFQPLEGSNDKAADLFALGKTLYEAWTGCDRLEFPSVPRAILDAEDWDPYGHQLNDILLRACHAQARKRFSSAAELAHALTVISSGHRRTNRRQWLVTAAGAVAATAGVFVASKRLHEPARVTWQRLRVEPFSSEGWNGHAGTVDWKRRRMYSLGGDKHICHFQSLDLDTFVLSNYKEISRGPKESGCAMLHPETGQLLAIESGDGDVFAMDVDSETISSLGGGPYRQEH